MADDFADNGFTVRVNAVTVPLPHKEDGTWSVKEILDSAAEQPAGMSQLHCPNKPNCFMVPEGTLVEIPQEPDPLQVSFVSPTEVRRLIAENHLWADGQA
jgi:hypothetical protein